MSADADIWDYTWSDGTPAKGVSVGEKTVYVAKGKWAVSDGDGPMEWLGPDHIDDLILALEAARKLLECG